jgi:hypothetical protein
MPTTLVVKRSFEPIGDSSGQWEQVRFSRVVWRCERGGVAVATKVTAPTGYVEGVLTCYVDGQKVDILDFEEVLADALGFTRADIEKALKEAV